MHDPLWAPDDRTSRGHGGNSGGAESFTPEESTRADLKKPEAESGLTPTETLPGTDMGVPQISGPGPHDLTRGLP